MSDKAYKEVTILLVEDDDIDAKAVQRAFTKLRIANSMHRAKDGIEALEYLENGVVRHPFIILLDLNMPRMGGLEFLSQIRSDKRWSDCVVFILTTSKADEDVLQAYQQHIAGYIVKENLQQGFDELVKLLDHYWRVVELPSR